MNKDYIVVDSFVRRLNKINIEVELRSNWPWIYLYSVNDNFVEERYYGNHGFTAFYGPTKRDGKNSVARFTNRRKVFSKIREMIEDE
tara:strand:- start:520 stop:780 length:261 start_codon:yes stop_codon:yes gene_type:complete